MKKVKFIVKSSLYITCVCVIGFLYCDVREVKASFFSRVFQNVARRVNRGAVSSGNTGLRAVPTQQNGVIQKDNTKSSDNSSSLTSRLTGVQGGLASNVDTKASSSKIEIGATGRKSSKSSSSGSVSSTSSLSSLANFDGVELEGSQKVKKNKGNEASSILGRINLEDLFKRDKVERRNDLSDSEVDSGARGLVIQDNQASSNKKIKIFDQGKVKTEVHYDGDNIVKTVDKSKQGSVNVEEVRRFDRNGNLKSYSVYENRTRVYKEEYDNQEASNKVRKTYGDSKITSDELADKAKPETSHVADNNISKDKIVIINEKPETQNKPLQKLPETFKEEVKFYSFNNNRELVKINKTKLRDGYAVSQRHYKDGDVQELQTTIYDSDKNIKKHTTEKYNVYDNKNRRIAEVPYSVSVQKYKSGKISETVEEQRSYLVKDGQVNITEVKISRKLIESGIRIETKKDYDNKGKLVNTSTQEYSLNKSEYSTKKEYDKKGNVKNGKTLNLDNGDVQETQV